MRYTFYNLFKSKTFLFNKCLINYECLRREAKYEVKIKLVMIDYGV